MANTARDRDVSTERRAAYHASKAEIKLEEVNYQNRRKVPADVKDRFMLAFMIFVVFVLVVGIAPTIWAVVMIKHIENRPGMSTEFIYM